MDQIQTSIMLLTSTHRIVGQIVSAGQRLQDILNNKLNTYLNLYDVEIFGALGKAGASIRCPDVTVPKDSINLVLIQEQVHEAPTQRLYRYVQKSTYQTFLTVPNYEIHGYLHFTSFQKPEIFLADTATSFVPITQAQVICAIDAKQTWELPVVFARRFAIELFHLQG